MQEIVKSHSVLFVCTANICRSPMAVGLFKHMIEGGSDIWRVESAGVYARVGWPAAEYTLQVLERRGIDLSEHRSRLITVDIAENFRLILTMEKNHKEAIQAAFPKLSGRIKLLTEIVGENRDIVDPIGRSYLEYEDTAREMESILKRGSSVIFHLAEEQSDD
jgi:protein arginine phosphatase